MPGLPVGTIKARAGYVSAAFDTATISVTGQGGHGAMPETTRDPIPAASALVLALNTIVSRNIKPLDAAVVTIGEMNSGPSSYNVIPQEMQLKISCRSLSADVQQTIKRRIHDICSGIGTAYDVAINCDYEEKYPAVFNDTEASRTVTDALKGIGNNFTVIENFDPVMGSEDFAFMSRKVAGCYFIIGNGDIGGPLHSPTYEFNDQTLATGIEAWVTIAEQLLQVHPAKPV